MTHHFSCSGREKIKKNIFRSQKGPKRAKKGQKGSFWVKIFKKMKIFQTFFFFDLNDSESKKGQKTMRISDFTEFLSLFVSVRLCIFFGHRSSRCMLVVFILSSNCLHFVFISFIHLHIHSNLNSPCVHISLSYSHTFVQREVIIFDFRCLSVRLSVCPL